MTEVTASVSPTPKQVAEMIYEMNAEEHAEMFEHLHDCFDGDHYLMMQFLNVRDWCLKRGGMHGKSMSAFQTMFASAFKYMSDC